MPNKHSQIRFSRKMFLCFLRQRYIVGMLFLVWTTRCKVQFVMRPCIIISHPLRPTKKFPKPVLIGPRSYNCQLLSPGKSKWLLYTWRSWTMVRLDDCGGWNIRLQSLNLSSCFRQCLLHTQSDGMGVGDSFKILKSSRWKASAKWSQGSCRARNGGHSEEGEWEKRRRRWTGFAWTWIEEIFWSCVSGDWSR